MVNIGCRNTSLRPARMATPAVLRATAWGRDLLRPANVRLQGDRRWSATRLSPFWNQRRPGAAGDRSKPAAQQSWADYNCLRVYGGKFFLFQCSAVASWDAVAV